MTKAELEAELRKYSHIDKETAALAEVVEAVSAFTPHSYFSGTVRVERRDKIARILRNAGERYGISLEQV